MNAKICGQGQCIKLYTRAGKIDRSIVENRLIATPTGLYLSQHLSTMLVQSVLVCIMITRFSWPHMRNSLSGYPCLDTGPFMMSEHTPTGPGGVL
jgi:hypothetical protein